MVALTGKWSICPIEPHMFMIVFSLSLNYHWLSKTKKGLILVLLGLVELVRLILIVGYYRYFHQIVTLEIGGSNVLLCIKAVDVKPRTLVHESIKFGRKPPDWLIADVLVYPSLILDRGVIASRYCMHSCDTSHLVRIWIGLKSRMERI